MSPKRQKQGCMYYWGKMKGRGEERDRDKTTSVMEARKNDKKKHVTT